MTDRRSSIRTISLKYEAVGSVAMPRVIKHPEVRRAEFLDHAEALLLSNGYDSVSLNDVIAAAGASKGAFYHWFPSKEASYSQILVTAAWDQAAALG